MKRMLPLAAVTAGLSLILTIAPTSAGSASATELGCGSVPRVENPRYSYSYDNFSHGPDWIVSGRAPGNLTLGRTLLASNTFSVSGGIDAGFVSATLGFDVTQSTSLVTSFTYPLPADPPGAGYIIQAGTRDDDYFFDVNTYGCDGTLTNSVRGTANRTGHVIYRTSGDGTVVLGGGHG